MSNQEKRKITKIAVSWILAVMCAVVMFYMSSQTAEESSVYSRGMADSFVSIMGFGTISEEIVLTYEGIIRETAHGIEYFILAFLVCNALYVSGCKKHTVWAIVICVLYGISDEIHQLFIPGRAFEIKDMTIDSVGSIVGSLVYLLFINKSRKQRKNINEFT